MNTVPAGTKIFLLFSIVHLIVHRGYCHDAFSHLEAGVQTFQEGNTQRAVAHLTEAVTIDPSYADAYFNLGVALMRAESYLDAATALKTTAALRPTDTEAVRRSKAALEKHCMTEVPRGMRLASQSRFDEAESVLRTAAHDAPPCSAALSTLGPIQLMRGRAHAALDVCRQALHHSPQDKAARTCVTMAHISLRQFQEAENAFAASPGALEAREWISRMYVRQALCHWGGIQKARQRLRRFLESWHLNRSAAESGADGAAVHIAWVAEVQGMSPRLILQVARLKAAAAEHAVRSQPRLPVRRTRLIPDIMTLGYTSSDFRDHPVGHAMHQVFALHAKQRFLAVGLSLDAADPQDEHRQQLQDVAHKWINLAGLTASAASLRVSRMGVHILINLNGHTRGARTDLFAMEPAPVQALLIGSCTSLGLKAVQYVAADRVSMAPHLTSTITERVLLLPYFHHPSSYWHLYGVETPSAPILLPTAPTKTRVVCFSRLNKLSPTNFVVWMHVLRRSPQVSLELFGEPTEAKAQLQAQVGALGISPPQMAFLGRLPKKEHLQRLSRSELALDTTAVGGMTTALDTLYAGVPIMVLHGDRLNNRFGLAATKALNIDTHVTTIKQYEDIASILLHAGAITG